MPGFTIVELDEGASNSGEPAAAGSEADLMTPVETAPADATQTGVIAVAGQKAAPRRPNVKSGVSKLAHDMFQILENENLEWVVESDPKKVVDYMIDALGPDQFQPTVRKEMSRESNKPLLKNVVEFIGWLCTSCKEYQRWEPVSTKRSQVGINQKSNTTAPTSRRRRTGLKCERSRKQVTEESHDLQRLATSNGTMFEATQMVQPDTIQVQTTTGPLLMRRTPAWSTWDIRWTPLSLERVTCLGAREVTRLEAILLGYRDVFRIALGNDPRIRVEPLRVRMREGASPVQINARRYPPVHMEYLGQHIQEMLDHGLALISPSSRWVSPPRIVAKSEPGTYRMTVDNQAFNERTDANARSSTRLIGRHLVILYTCKNARPCECWPTPAIHVRCQLDAQAYHSLQRTGAHRCQENEAVVPSSSEVGWNEEHVPLCTVIDEQGLKRPSGQQNHRPSAFLIGRFTVTQLRWPTIETEAFAIVKSAKCLDHMLLRPGGFHLFTDLRNLVYVFNPTATDGAMQRYQADKLQRWVMPMASYHNVIEHICGSDNVWADMFSRWGNSKHSSSSGIAAVNQVIVVPPVSPLESGAFE
ncbi:hypothetical protein ON010_g6589 [Phytophthora cinnamomi]|nr:hypothetical protein ON010_g6589 [Phytophthora cinnamomi]